MLHADGRASSAVGRAAPCGECSSTPPARWSLTAGSGSLVPSTAADQILELRLAGGAGFGDPRERPLELIQHDLDHGYITARAVVEDYGKAMTADGRVVPATGPLTPDDRDA